VAWLGSSLLPGRNPGFWVSVKPGLAQILLAEITPGGKRAAAQFRQLIDIKDTAHYGFISVTAPQLKRALRQVQHLIDFAEQAQLRSGSR